MENQVISIQDANAEMFKSSMYEQEVLRENFDLRVYSYGFVNEHSFNDIVENFINFREFISQSVFTINKEMALSEVEPLQIVNKDIATLYIDIFDTAEDNGPLGSYAFALWFMRLGGENWLKFENVQKQAQQYLNPDSNNRFQLRLFKGFKYNSMITNGLTTLDLPVVINYEARTVSIWTCGLFD